MPSKHPARLSIPSVVIGRTLRNVLLLLSSIEIGMLVVCLGADCAQPSNIGVGKVFLLKTPKNNRVEVLKMGSSWRADTYWYSLIPARDRFIMFNDSSKRYAYCDLKWMEPNRAKPIVNSPLIKEANKNVSCFGGPRFSFSWSQWTRTRNENVCGANLALYTRTAKAKVFKRIDDGATGMLDDLLPAASDTGKSVSSQIGADRKLLRNVNATEELWVLESEKSPSLLQTIRVMFGCETRFGLPLKNIESVEGTDKSGKPGKTTITYVKLVEVRTKEMKNDSFRLPEGYKQVADQFSVMIDDAGAEQMIFTGQ